MGYKEEYSCSTDGRLISINGEDVDDSKSNDGDEPLAGDLNIFLPIKQKDNTFEQQVVRVNFGDKPSDFIEEETSDGFRWVSIRAPIMVGGWGYDTDGNHLLGTTEEEINKNKLNRESWKYGPVDLRWSEERKLWVAGGGAASVKFLEFVDSEESE